MIYEVHVQVLNNSDLKMLQAYLVRKNLVFNRLIFLCEKYAVF